MDDAKDAKVHKLEDVIRKTESITNFEISKKINIQSQ